MTAEEIKILFKFGLVVLGTMLVMIGLKLADGSNYNLGRVPLGKLNMEEFLS